MPYKDPERNREARRLYRRTPKGRVVSRAVTARFSKSPKGILAKARAGAMKYGLSPEQIERMFVEQAGVCKCCGDEISLIPKSPNVRHIDHDHAQEFTPGRCKKEAVRGLLCSNCNRILGFARESIGRLKLAILYLEEFQ